MTKSTPELIDPLRLADQGRELRGSYPLATLERLVPMLHQPQGEVNFTLRFSRVGDGTRLVRGKVQATLVLTCQRCLMPMEFLVDQSVCLGVIETLRAADLLSEELEPLLVEGPVSLRDLVEDELLLAVPVVARHDLHECPAREFIE